MAAVALICQVEDVHGEDDIEGEHDEADAIVHTWRPDTEGQVCGGQVRGGNGDGLTAQTVLAKMKRTNKV